MSRRSNNRPRGLVQREKRTKTITLRVSETVHEELDKIRRRAARHGVDWSIQEALHSALLEEVEAMQHWVSDRDSERAAQMQSGALAPLPPSELRD